MLGLVIDTSSERSIIAIVEREQVLFSQDLSLGYRNTRFLILAIQKGLQTLNITGECLGFIAVGVGPGSYTGMRVGVAVAKCLAMGWGVPLVGLCSLRGFVPEEEKEDKEKEEEEEQSPFAAVVDAKMSGVYLLEADGPAVVALKDLPSRIGPSAVIVTPSAERLRGKFQEQTGWKWLERAPSVKHLASYAWEQVSKGRVSHDGQLDILYLRKTQAEIER